MIREFTFPRSRRLRLRRDYARVFSQKCSVADGRLVVYIAPNDLGHSRMGLSVGKLVGGAVARHRVKRLIREAFRLSQHALPSGLDIICVARPTRASLDDYRSSLLRLIPNAQRKLERRTRQHS